MLVDSDHVMVTENLVVEEISEKPKRRVLPSCSYNWKAVLAEFVSTISLLFLGCMTCIPIDGLDMNPPLYGTIGFGLIVLINIQTFGHISGAHMNPAVTFAAMLCSKMSIALGLGYILAQCSGAVVGYGILVGLSPTNMSSGVCITQPHVRHTVYQALCVEILLTVALVLINCAVWDPINKDKNESNSIKFGLTVAGLSVSGGPLTGASMNPARSLGPAVWTNIWTDHWIYWAGPFLGSAAAAICYKYIWHTKKELQEPEILTWTGSRCRIEENIM